MCNITKQTFMMTDQAGKEIDTWSDFIKITVDDKNLNKTMIEINKPTISGTYYLFNEYVTEVLT